MLIRSLRITMEPWSKQGMCQMIIDLIVNSAFAKPERPASISEAPKSHTAFRSLEHAFMSAHLPKTFPLFIAILPPSPSITSLKTCIDGLGYPMMASVECSHLTRPRSKMPACQTLKRPT